MPHPFLRLRGRRNDLRFGTALALSILVHAAALLSLMSTVSGRLPSPGPGNGTTGGLEVRLAVLAATLAASPAREQAQASGGAQRSSTPARTVPKAAAPVARTAIAQGAQADSRNARETLSLLTAPDSPDPVADAPARGPEWWRLTSAALAQARAAPSSGGDLASAIAARHREQAEPSTAAYGEGNDRGREGWGSPAPQSPIEGDRPNRGGVFTITRMAYNDGEFLFFGWKDDPDPRPAQAIHVRLGANRDMRIAIVRRMIALIREHEHGDFRWQSWRLGRVVELSARAEDTGGLEDFLLREFFEARTAAATR